MDTERCRYRDWLDAIRDARHSGFTGFLSVNT